MINAKIIGMLLAAFVAGSFVASPELRAYAAATITSADIVDGQVKNADLATNAVTTSKINDGAVKTADIGDGEVKADDIAENAVGASEIQGVTKLIFAECFKSAGVLTAGAATTVSCSVPGALVNENVIATFQADNCFSVVYARVSGPNVVSVKLINECGFDTSFGDSRKISIIVFDIPKKPIPT